MKQLKIFLFFLLILNAFNFQGQSKKVSFKVNGVCGMCKARIESVLDVETNIVVANLKSSYSNSSFIDKLNQKGVLAIPFGAGRIRMVTHLDVSKNEIDEVVSAVGF